MHSNSSLNCYANCQMRYKLSYIDGIKPDKISPHLTFGIMAHDVMYKAGKLRDDHADGLVSESDYYPVIPSETLYPELKDAFKIDNWHEYFVPVIKQVSLYEKDAIDKLASETGLNVSVSREVKLSVSGTHRKELEGAILPQGQMDGITGVIDLLIYNEAGAIILDYKFSNSRKGDSDFEENSQLQLYAYLVHMQYDIAIHNIYVGYIDIPKQMYGKPIVLSNGNISRSKSQNCTAEMYALYVRAQHGDDEYYNCKPGGYYYDCYCELKLNKAAYIAMRSVDKLTYSAILSDLMNTTYEIDRKKNTPGTPWLRKYDSYSCKGCEYKKHCKPWLTEVW